MLRAQFVNTVRSGQLSVAEACRRAGISRDTAYRWLRRYDQDPHAPLLDLSTRPHRSPARTPQSIERRIVETRVRYGWGARKIHAHLERRGLEMPSVRTVHQVLARAGLVNPPAGAPPAPIQRFEREAPNQLWQVDHKCDTEIGRTKRDQLTVIDDHSRYLLALRPVRDRAITTAFAVLWELMGRVGMPDAILTDNAFSTKFTSPATLSWFDANLVCLGIDPIHGRPYHPQTQGKVERLHGTLEREFLPNADRSSLGAYTQQAEAWRHLYNTVRPHEGIGDVPPADRWRPSVRSRPRRVPSPQYPDQSVVRKVGPIGDVRWQRHRIMAGRGLAGRQVRVEEAADALELYFAHVRIRSIRYQDLKLGCML